MKLPGLLDEWIGQQKCHTLGMYSLTCRGITKHGFVVSKPLSLLWLCQWRGAPTHPIRGCSWLLCSALLALPSLWALWCVFSSSVELGLLHSCNWAQRIGHTRERDACAAELGGLFVIPSSLGQAVGFNEMSVRCFASLCWKALREGSAFE